MPTTVAERPIEQTIRSLIQRHHLSRIEITVTAGIINARAIPLAYHPQVAVNRHAALEKAARLAGGSISMQEAQRITEAAPQTHIAVAYADTMQELLKALRRELKAL